MVKIDTTMAFSHLVTHTPNENNTNSEGSAVNNPATTAVGALILGLVFLLGVPGNAFIIWSILARARKRSITTLLILNLAFADGFIMALTIFFVVYLAKRSWVFGNTACQLLFYLCNTNMYASILLITLMSLHRLMAVVWPHHESALTNRRSVQRLLLGLWILVLLMAIPGYVFRGVKRDNQTTENIRYECNPDHQKNPKHLIFHYTFETVVGFLIPYTIIVGSYVCILRRLRQTKFRRRIRSENLIMAIVVTFGLFWLPYHILNIVQVKAELSSEELQKSLTDFSSSCRPITSSLAFISSCANPVLYTFAGKSYIQKNGFSFMARLFEGTALDSGTKKTRQVTREPKDVAFTEKETDSSTSATTSMEKSKI